jgi:hypothetical protein
VKQREVQDEEGVRWTCVQALAGVESAVAEDAAELLESDDGTVPVVCTPSGGARSVRLELPREWVEQVADDELQRAIREAQAS